MLFRPGEVNDRCVPVCVRECRWSSSLRVKRLPQNNQLQMNGRSPANGKERERGMVVLLGVSLLTRVPTQMSFEV